MAHKIVEIIARGFLLLYGVIDLIGTFWFLEGSLSAEHVFGFGFSLPAIVVGVFSANVFITASKGYLYILLCVVGLIASLGTGFHYFFSDFYGKSDLVIQFFLLISFIYLGILAAIEANEERGRV